MPTLVLNAPRERVVLDGAQPFRRIVRDGPGPGYAIPSRYADILIANPSGWTVLLLDKTDRKSATGKLVKIVSTGERAGNIARYDVYVEGFQPASYRNVSLSRTGIAIID